MKINVLGKALVFMNPNFTFMILTIGLEVLQVSNQNKKKIGEISSP